MCDKGRNLSFLLSVLFYLLLVLTSCDSKPLKPYMVEIPQDKMVEVLIDVYMCDATVKNYSMHNHHVYVKKQYYDTLFARHNISERQFVWNIIRYTRKMKIEGIIDKSIVILSERKAVFEKKMVNTN